MIETQAAELLLMCLSILLQWLQAKPVPSNTCGWQFQHVAMCLYLGDGLGLGEGDT
jgi:hypothetical protein